jgi:hypothetical protein
MANRSQQPMGGTGLRAHGGENHIGIQNDPVTFHPRLTLIEFPIVSSKKPVVNTLLPKT